MTEAKNPSVKNANTLLSLQFLSDFGDQITTALLALSILDITKSTGKVGLVYFITTIGFVAFTLVGGALGDQLSKRNILFFSDIGRGLVVLLMIFALKDKSIVLIYVTSFFLSVLGSLHRPVKLSTWTESIPGNFLERYNSLSELSIQASMILGPLIASFFVIREWTSIGFAIDALTFFVCAIIFTQIISDRAKPTHFARQNKRDFLKGFRLIVQQAEMSKYVAYDAIQMIGFGAFNATFLVLAQRDFGWSKVDYSYHLSIVALFTTLGAFMGATSYAAKVNHITKLVTCALISAVCLWVMLRIQSFPLSSILFGICNGMGVLTMTVTRTKVQLVAKNCYGDFLSSIIASRSIIIKAATLLGTGACLLIDDFISLEATLVIFVIPIALSCVPFVINRSKRLSYEIPNTTS